MFKDCAASAVQFTNDASILPTNLEMVASSLPPAATEEVERHASFAAVLPRRNKYCAHGSDDMA